MKHISIIVPYNAVLGSVEGPRQVFTEANKFIMHTGGPEFCRVQLIGLQAEVPVCGGKYTVNADALINDIRKTDLIIIPALDGDMPEVLAKNKEFIPWIIRHYKEGAEVASLCIGAFMLASTGLVNGKTIATHWLAASDFRKMFPEVDLVEEKIITEEQGIYSSGGAFSYLNLILHILAKYAGKEVAIFMAKAFQIEYERKSQSPFIIFNGQKEHEDEQIKKSQEFIEHNFQEKISVDQLSKTFGIGRRTLERRFKKATSNSVTEYIQRVRIEAAKKFLESGRKTVNEAMYDVGYTDNHAFREVFKKITGMTPLDYRNKYNFELVA